MTSPDTHGATLSIDLDAVAFNWNLMRSALAAGCVCGAAVKADAYGVGVAQVAPVLAGAGCRDFFVATLDEGIALRALLDGPAPDAHIYILNGLLAGTAPIVAAHRLTPVLNTPTDIDTFTTHCRQNNTALPACLHVDTGMARLGLSPQDLKALADVPSRLDGIDLRYLISHLACADESDNALNVQQLDSFKAALAIAPPAKASLANSSGIFLGTGYHFDLARPGAALYGVNPTPLSPNPMRQVVRLQAKILQTRRVDTPQTVGYGATHRVSGPARIATIAVGYADGYLRSSSNKGCAYIDDIRAPIVGRVSMDLITIDVSNVAEAKAQPGMSVDLIGPHNPVDAVAAAAGTIGYEVLTSLGPRYGRVYQGGVI